MTANCKIEAVGGEIEEGPGGWGHGHYHLHCCSCVGGLGVVFVWLLARDLTVIHGLKTENTPSKNVTDESQ